jgi:integrase
MRTRLMLALAYDAGLRREELCSLRTDDLDPAYRTLHVRAVTTKTRRARVVPYSEPTGVLLHRYLAWRHELTTARGRLFVSESRRNRAQPLRGRCPAALLSSRSARRAPPSSKRHNKTVEGPV